jgi:hypothetical protein
MHVEQDGKGYREEETKSNTPAPPTYTPSFCTTVVTARYFTLTLTGIVARAMEMTACTVLAPLGSST